MPAWYSNVIDDGVKQDLLLILTATVNSKTTAEFSIIAKNKEKNEEANI